MAGPGVIVVRRTGDVLSCAARWLFVNIAILALAYSHLARRGTGGGLCRAIAITAALIGLASFLLWKTLPGSTVIDAEGRTVKVRENGWRTKTIPFDDIDGVHIVRRGAKTGYGLSLRGAAPAARLMITDMLDESDAYRREFSLQLLPKLESMLPSYTKKDIK